MIQNGDSDPTRILPLSLLLNHDLYLDRFVPRVFRPDRGYPGSAHHYRVLLRRGHWISVYPVVVSIFVAPLYVPLAWYVKYRGLPLEGVEFAYLIDLQEKVTASLIACASAAFVYLFLSELCESRRSVIALTLAYALGSNTWVISSQALWQHGISELLIAATIWWLLRAETNVTYLFGVGCAAALAVANRPPNIIFAILILLYVISRYRTAGWRTIVAGIPIAFAFVSYNLYFFGTFTGRFTTAPSLWNTPILTGLAGLLLSPSRGLFVYTPWTLFSLSAIVLAFSSPAYSALHRYLALAVVSEVLLYSKWWCWWGGGCFGPRMLTDIMPILTFLILPLRGPLRACAVLKIAFAALVLASIGIQTVGAYFAFNEHTEDAQLWSWNHCQLAEAIRKDTIAFGFSKSVMK
jgi:hypothetical protein